jgi:glycosyltransferase involved in cell wall biosynthesis/SAM-dependent methyltransferase
MQGNLMTRKPMAFTGERYIPRIDWPEISYEHWHRYMFASEFAAGKVVLDLASGEGFGSNLLADRAAKVIGVDISPEAVAHATAHYAKSNLEFRSGPADAVPLYGRQLLDVIVSFETIEHLDERQQIGFSAECKRLLKSDGQLIVSTPNKLLYSDRHEFRNEFHLREFYLDEFVGFLNAHFRHVVLFGQRVYPASLIWPAEEIARSLQEFQLSYNDGEYSPAVEDRKELLYLLAVCSDEHISPPPFASIMLDVSERATAVRAQQLTEQEQELEALTARNEQDSQTIRDLQSLASEQDSELAGALATVAERDAAIHDLQGQLADARERTEAVRREIDLLGQALRNSGEMQAQLRALQDERATLEREVAERRLEQAELAHAELKSRLAAALVEKAAAERQASEIEGEREKLAALLAERQAAEQQAAEKEAAQTQIASMLAEAESRQVTAGEAPFGEIALPTPAVALYIVGGVTGSDKHPAARDFPVVDRKEGQSKAAQLAQVAQLVGEAMAAGGTHLLVPPEYADWLSDHPLVANYLVEHHDLAEASADTGIVFALRQWEEDQDEGAALGESTGIRPGIEHLRFSVEFPRTLPLSSPTTTFDPTRLDLHWLMSSFGRGMGGPMTIFRIIQYLEKFGHKNTIWTANGSDPQDARRIQKMIRKDFLPLNAEVRVLSDRLDDVRGDAVIATHCLTAYPARAITNVRERFYFVQDFEPYFYPMGARYLLAEDTYRFGFTCIAASPWLRDLLTSRYGARAEQFELAYDPSVYFPDERVRRRKKHVAFYSRIGTERRVVELGLLALELVAQQHPDLVVHFFGDWLRDFNPPYAYKNHGVMKEHDLADLYRRASVGIVFSSSNYSLIPNEMMACGLPVVELASPCTSAVFPNGVVTLAEPSPLAIADAVSKLLADEDLRERQRERGLAHVAGLTWEGSARRVEAALTSGILDRSVANGAAPTRSAPPSKRRSRRAIRAAERSNVSFDRPIVFAGQPEYFRQTYFDETSTGSSFEFPFTSADPSALRELPRFVKEHRAKTCIIFRPEWLAWYRDVFDELKANDVALIGYSTEPVPHGWADPHPDQLKRLESLKDALKVDYDLIVHFDQCSLRLLREVGFERIIAHPLPVSKKLFFPEDLPREFDVCFLGRSTPHREAFLVPLKARYNTLHVAHGLTDDDARTLMNRSKMVVNIHTHEYPSFETRSIMALRCQRPLLSEWLSGDYLVADRDYTLVTSPKDLKDKVEQVLNSQLLPPATADLSKFSIESLLTALGVK